MISASLFIQAAFLTSYVFVRPYDGITNNIVYCNKLTCYKFISN